MDVYPCDTRLREQYCLLEEHMVEGDFFTEITKYLNRYGEIALVTAFDSVKDYVWHGEEGEKGPHIDHCTYLLGEDRENYYIADSPGVIKDSGHLERDGNKSVYGIPKGHFSEAFGRYCMVMTISYKNLPDTEEAEYSYFQGVCGEICSDYRRQVDADGNAIGKTALEMLAQEILDGNELAMKEVFAYHMIISKRIILQRCLSIVQRFSGDTERLESLLDESVMHWGRLKDLACECLFSNRKVCMAARDVIGEIVGVEDVLMEELQKWYLGLAMRYPEIHTDSLIRA